MKKLTIKDLMKEYKMGEVVLKATISNGLGDEEIVWYEFDRKYDEFICDDRIDGIFISIFLTAIKFDYDVIESDIPISEELYYNIVYHVIPQYCTLEKCTKIKIDVPVTKERFYGKGVATGLSLGVDSFTTIYEYGKDFELSEYKITHYTYFNAGAHHGQDLLVGNSKLSSKDLYERQLARTVEFCQKNGLELIVVNSNIAKVLASPKLFGRWYFNRTHTYRNLGIALLLQKGINKYYYSSAYNLDQFRFGMELDCALYEKWLIGHLSTESVKFFNSNQEWSRQEKVKHIVELEESYDYLTVCLINDKNCGVCTKCRRTLMELDALGEDVLDKYSNSFDLEIYKNQNRNVWFSDIWELKDKGDGESVFFKEILSQALKTHPEILSDPVVSKNVDKKIQVVPIKSRINIRMFPSTEAKIVGKAKKGENFQYIGEYKDWLKIRLKNGNDAYIYSAYAEKRKVGFLQKVLKKIR